MVLNSLRWGFSLFLHSFSHHRSVEASSVLFYGQHINTFSYQIHTQYRASSVPFCVPIVDLLSPADDSVKLINGLFGDVMAFSSDSNSFPLISSIGGALFGVGRRGRGWRLLWEGDPVWNEIKEKKWILIKFCIEQIVDLSTAAKTNHHYFFQFTFFLFFR